MRKKKELLKECAVVFQSRKVREWYEKSLQTKPQAETVNSLEAAVSKGDLSVREALCIALVVGVQWNVKFEGAE